MVTLKNGIFSNIINGIKFPFPKSIESENIEFHKNQLKTYEAVCYKINKSFKDIGFHNSEYSVNVEIVYEDTETDIHKIKIRVLKELRATLTWISPRNFKYSCWYIIPIVGFEVNNDNIMNFLQTQFIDQNLSEWRKNDPLRIF